MTLRMIAFARAAPDDRDTGKDHKERHQTRIECVPAGFEEAADASIYFKKELQEAGAPPRVEVVRACETFSDVAATVAPHASASTSICCPARQPL
jgi:hypothetical protein